MADFDIPALVARLESLAHRYDMTHTERYEADSEAFYAATGYMAPGKDVPMAMGGQDEQERRRAHETWIQARNEAQKQTLRDAADALTAARDAAERDAPEIQVGDWVLTRFFGNTLIRVSSAQVLDALDRGALLEARGERNGQPFIWRRRQEGQ